MKRGLLMLSLAWLGLTLSLRASAEAVPCVAKAPVTKTNHDGSRLRVTRECIDREDGDDDDAPRYRFQVSRAAPGEDDFKPLPDLQNDDMGEPPRYVHLIDIDGDGSYEVEARGMCGASPNCLGDLYRFDGNNRLIHFFSGAYAELRWLDGYLIESGRASCCAWEHHAWRVKGHALPIDYDNMDLMITIGADLSSDDENAPPRCTFQRGRGDNWQVVAPPGEAWKDLCRIYGDDFHLVTPEEARAEAAAQEQ